MRPGSGAGPGVVGRVTALRLGERGPAVVVLRDLLARAGAIDAPADEPSAADQDFDAAVDAAVRRFQQERGVIADGVVGPVTAQHLAAAGWRLGDRVLAPAAPMLHGDDVSALQERLVKLGLHAGAVDGIFGPSTEASLRELQRGLGVTCDGVFGSRTFGALAALGRAVEGGDPWTLRSREHVAMAGKSLNGKIVCLDAGRGGGRAHAPEEARAGHEVCRRVAARLTSAGATVGLTRSVGEDPSIAERAAFAADLGADLVLSFQCESTANPLAQGFATFYWGGGRVAQHSAVGRTLATFLQREVVARSAVVDCRAHPCSYDLVRMTVMPTVIVSVGYLSNPEDATRLSQPAFLETLADAVLAAVQRVYLGEDDTTVTGTLGLADVLARARGDLPG